MYAEYASHADRLKVWRSVDDGHSWSQVFSAAGTASEAAQIRHFHTLMPDPHHAGHWYLSSGDAESHSRIWVTRDSGGSWLDVSDPHPKGMNRLDLHRHTSLWFTRDHLYWGTDDGLDGNARLVRARRGTPLAVESIGLMGEAVRTLVSTPDGFVFVSEAKNATGRTPANYADVHFSSDLEQVVRVGGLLMFGADNGVTFSRASIQSIGNTFFSYGESRTVRDFSPILRGHAPLSIVRRLESLYYGVGCRWVPWCEPPTAMWRWDVELDL